ncbi:SH3 domain-binding protein 2-like isoform X2 [Lytechinus variegatus]|uniref:SH3 domain-binding protein 2-like isoform X2 n=1 Tax=Lytechinus variegatus TaxID=7654 RepID=UPI001BB261FF|nr:SH3 domain-binding protein 2-like isoform X2 [Lytechinus variegatus]XP_041477621.1 SH3 domain-binding protein 2-like isoform X2 [Lytechinus variegatus]
MAWKTGRESMISINFPTSLHLQPLQRTTSESCLHSREGLENISAHDILLRDVMHCGFLYKKAQDRKVDVLGEVGEQVGRVLGFQDRSRRWQLRYVIIYQHYVLYFRDDKAKKPQGVFSLTGYNRVMRDEAVSDERKWSFKIIGLRSDSRTWYFNAASEKEMKLWMAYFKVAMEQAIHGKAREKSLKILQDLKYKNSHRDTLFEDESRHSGSSSGGSTSGSNDPLVYEDIEMPLYDDTASPTSPNSPLHRPLPSLPPCIDEFDASPRRSSAGARSGIQRPDQLSSRSTMDPDQGVGLGARTHSDPTKQQNDHSSSSSSSSSSSCSSSGSIRGSSMPGSRHKISSNSAPGSPSSRPRCPEPLKIPHFDEDYITPEMDAQSPSRPLPPTPGTPKMGQMIIPIGKSLQQEIENRKRREPSSKRLTTRQPSIDEGLEEDKPTLRRGPEGNSFRKPITERPHFPEPVVKPLVSAKPSDANKPATRPKPKITPKPQVKPKPSGGPATVSLLPDAASIQSSDKVYTEGLLRKYRCDGMYLVRLGSEQGQVLMVWDSQNSRCKHYKIFQDQDSNLHLDHVPKFDNILRLLEHYKTNALPNSNLYLQKAFSG